jgi:hypothetical protein
VGLPFTIFKYCAILNRTTPIGRYRRGRKNSTLGKEERYSYNKMERVLYMEERKLVLMMRIRNQWMRRTISGI